VYQLYWPNDDELAASLVRRAEATGYSALVLTVDNYLPGWKPRDLQQAYLPFLEGIGIAPTDPVPLRLADVRAHVDAQLERALAIAGGAK